MGWGRSCLCRTIPNNYIDVLPLIKWRLTHHSLSGAALSGCLTKNAICKGGKLDKLPSVETWQPSSPRRPRFPTAVTCPWKCAPLGWFDQNGILPPCSCSLKHTTKSNQGNKTNTRWISFEHHFLEYMTSTL